VDVTDPDELAGFVQRSALELGGLDLLVSNVSAGNVKGPTSWETSLRGDLVPFATLVEASLPHLEASDRAAVVAIGTTNASDTARPAGANSYSALKAAVVQHASALAHALAPKGIRVNTVSPGPIDFPGGAWETIRTSRPEVYEEVLAKLPIGRYGTPEDVAAAVVRAIEGNRAEVDVAPALLRAGARLSGLVPELAATLSRRLGSREIAERIAAGQRGKR
jgi:3-oxoacyl-[acyl-carrier protein] reductase